MSEAYLLDTCTAIWMSQDQPIAPVARLALSNCRENIGRAYVSSVTAWEMSMLLARGRIRQTKDAKRWYDDLRQEAQIAEVQVTADVFIASYGLPGPIHKDPMDRLLIATAREHDLTIITRDRAILAYGTAGHVKTLAC